MHDKLIKLVGIVSGMMVVAIVFFGIGYQFPKQDRFGSGSSALVLGSGLEVNGSSTFSGGTVITGGGTVSGGLTVNGATALNGSLTVSSTGTAIDWFKLTQTSIDADSIGNGAATTSVVSVSGVNANDMVSVGLTGSWAAPSSSVVVTGVASAANTVTLYFKNTSSTAVNLTGSLYNIQVVSN